MRFLDLVSTKALAITRAEVASNKVPYLGVGFFPTTKKVEHNDTVYPLQMLEFGSGIYGLPPTSAFGGYGGKGTFSSRGHSDDFIWWYATDIDENGKPTNWHVGTAIEPTRPMYHAWMQMYSQVHSIAREVFR